MPEHANNVVHVSPEARRRYQECLLAIEAARTWALGTDLVEGLVGGDDLNVAQALVHERERHVTEMERSFHANVSRLIFRPMGEGLLTIHTDTAPLSFFWRHESGYHGGLTYLASHDASGRLPVGTWSVHT